MVRKPVGVGTFVPYVGEFPSFGSVPPFRLISITYPLSGFVDDAMFFVKPGHSTNECGNPAAVVQLTEGSTLTPAQITAIYGSSRPHFDTLHPLVAVACIDGPSFPSVITLNMSIQND
jgi:hypothetical protein